MNDKELQLKQKQVAPQAGESTRREKIFVPAVDIYETETAVTVVAEMPGVCKECVEVGLDNGELTIRGWIKDPDIKAEEKVLLQEYENGSFLRRFSVAETIDQERIGAALADGLLTITLPKVEPAKPRRIEVQVA
ncbi:MAG: Hsp20/alpha crystallin family protein [Thermodesulfobacteriota bacterium]